VANCAAGALVLAASGKASVFYSRPKKVSRSSSVLALLDYIDKFNQGEFRNPDGKPASEFHQWPHELTDESVIKANGRPLNMPWAFWIIRNVHEALQSFAVQS